MFSANRQSDCSLCNSLICKLRIVQLTVSCTCRMNYKGFNVSNVCKKTENLQIINKLPCSIPATFDFKRKDRSSTVREIFFVQSMIRMIFQRRMINLLNFRMIFKEFHNLISVFNMTVKAQRQSFSSLQKKECIKRTDCSPLVTQQNCTNISYKRSRSNSIRKTDSMITWIWLRNRTIFSAFFPVKFSRIYYYTAKSCSMATNKFCCRMNNNVRTMFNRANKIWSSKSIINYKRKSMLVGNFSNRINIRNIRIRISQSFKIHSLCIFLDCPFNLF